MRLHQEGVMETNEELSGLAQAADTNVKPFSTGLVFKITDLGEVTRDRMEENSDWSLGPPQSGVGQCMVHEGDQGGHGVGGEPVEVGERLSPRGK